MNECQNNCGTATAATTIQQQVVRLESPALSLGWSRPLPRLHGLLHHKRSEPGNPPFFQAFDVKCIGKRNGLKKIVYGFLKMTSRTLHSHGPPHSVFYGLKNGFLAVRPISTFFMRLLSPSKLCVPLFSQILCRANQRRLDL